MRLRKSLIVAGPLGCTVLLMGVVLTLVFFACGGLGMLSRPPMYFRTIKIDTQTMTAELSDPFPGRERPAEPYYTTWTTHGGWGPHSVRDIYHYDGSKNLPYRVRYNALTENHDKRIIARSKQQELTHGPYGTVYANTSYYYGIKPGSDFHVSLYANKAEHEPAQVVDSLPQPRPPLDAISIVRVFRTPPGYAVVVATYNAQGNRKGAGNYWSEGGDWQAGVGKELSEQIRALGASKEAPDELYGFPFQFPIADYVDRSAWVWKDVGKPNPENFINLHYDYNRWVRQDAFDVAGKRTTRYLTFVVTPEDLMLEPIDRQIPFDTRVAR